MALPLSGRGGGTVLSAKGAGCAGSSSATRSTKNNESLQPIVNVVNEASAALESKGRTIRKSVIPEALSGALGAGIGGTGSFAALYSLV